ncbi:benzoate 4-monooxygenase cytochrome P450 [Fusarium albosuccineum]|uniref:Benzoate 4-monooxygenase cytochrome P450 n=1 Tax=Fusarium albosuccineum TaxID=1237068 RepID=A0A8H4KXM6_9HYPO|nr:benzoate 4-monooxygenase cytochrome P450 [Fusarium albosuccineum]
MPIEDWVQSSGWVLKTVPNMFATLSSKPHSVRKRMISNVYSKSYIQSSQASKCQMTEILLNRVLPALRTSSLPANGNLAHSDIEVFRLFLAIAMDLITAYIFGLSGGTDFITQESYRRDWQEMYLARANYPFCIQEVPKLTAFCTNWFPWFRVYPEWVDKSNAELSRWNWNLYENVKNQRNGLNEGGKRNDADEPVVYDALEAGIDRESKVNGESSVLYTTSILQRDQAIASELMDHSLAGQETAGIALAYATWHISRSPKLQQQLRDEIALLELLLKFNLILTT